MATAKVLLSADVYFLCLTHALSTEKEEVMGLLIGEIDSKDALHLTSAMLLRRSDKKKDRVEISPEQLMSASDHAEELAKKLNRPMRVLGWYHSHPHITVWPSHIDLRTQATYQMMDSIFVGLIFSVYSQDNNTNAKATPHQIQLTCFQSVNQSTEGEPPQYERLEVPIFIVPSPKLNYHCMNMLLKLPKILYEEEEEIFSSTKAFTHQDLLASLTNESAFTRALCCIVETISVPLQQTLESMIAQKDQEIENKKAKLQNLQAMLESLEGAHSN